MKLFDSESHFHRWILSEARDRGWTAAHLEPFKLVRTPKGAVPVAMKDAAGFPDLVLTHDRHGLVFAECKMPRDSGPDRELRPDQVVWLTALAPWARVYVWLPAHQDEVLAVLDGYPITSRLFDPNDRAVMPV